jgi:hypothetical protein
MEEVDKKVSRLLQAHLDDKGASRNALSDLQKPQDLKGPKSLPEGGLTNVKGIDQLPFRREAVTRLEAAFENGLANLVDNVFRHLVGLDRIEHKERFENQRLDVYFYLKRESVVKKTLNYYNHYNDSSNQERERKLEMVSLDKESGVIHNESVNKSR